MACFEPLDYQRQAIESVVRCFFDPTHSGARVSRSVAELPRRPGDLPGLNDGEIYANEEVPDTKQVLRNLQAVQRDNKLPISRCLRKDPMLGCQICLDVEMETGTGKTYVYTRTMLELFRKYGWDHFVLSVPTVAIRQGVLTSLRDTEEHFRKLFDGARIHIFAYDSANNDTVTKAFCGQAAQNEVHLLLLNAQKFNKAAQNIIHGKREMLGGASASACIAKTKPIVILDEPQKQGGMKTQEGLCKFGPMAVLHYSATHAVHHELVYRLGASEALRQKLVKQITVFPADVGDKASSAGGTYVRNLSFKEKRNYVQRVEILCRQTENGRLTTRRVRPALGEDLSVHVGYVSGYDGVSIQSIDAKTGAISVSSSRSESGLGITEHVLKVGEAVGQGNADELRRLQIKAAVLRHLKKEAINFRDGIKTLTLFFIDHVVRYTGDSDTKARDGEYAQWLQELYKEVCASYLSTLTSEEDKPYRDYLERTIASDEAIRSIHGGYFSSDPKLKEDAESEVVADYDVILNDKSALLRVDKENVTGKEAIRFIFSHSALREGWDNPNVFTLCFLKDGSRKEGTLRQELGRGLRICVDQTGKRRHDGENRNQLTVVTTDSYKDFVEELQQDNACRKTQLVAMLETLVVTEDGERLVDVAKRGTRSPIKSILNYLESIGALKDDRLKPVFRERYTANTLPEPSRDEPWAAYRDIIFAELAAIDPAPPQPENGEVIKKVSLNRREDLPTDVQNYFRAVAKRISIAVRYNLSFSDEDVVERAIGILDNEWKGALPGDRIFATFTEYVQNSENPQTFEVNEADGSTETIEVLRTSSSQRGAFDLVQDVMRRAGLSRPCVCNFLKRVWERDNIRNRIKYDYDAFVQVMASCLIRAWQEYATNPQSIEYVRTCDPGHEAFERERMIWAPCKDLYDERKLLAGMHTKHAYTILPIDTADEKQGGTEGKFAASAEADGAIMLYAKVPKTFSFPTPIGNYTPDWIVLLKQGYNGIRFHKLFFVCETKGGGSNEYGEVVMDSLRPVEKGKIQCMQKLVKLFEQDLSNDEPSVHYTVLNANGPNGGTRELLEKAQEA